MKIAIHGKAISENTIHLLNRLLQYLDAQQVQLFATPPLYALLSENNFTRLHLLPSQHPTLDLIISVGGDGTLLEAVDYVVKAETPVLGINTGRMGFLATVTLEDALEALEKFVKREHELDCRALLQITSTANNVNHFALNEVAVLKQGSAPMLAVYLCIDDNLKTTYWADGLIIATSTGSTGYSLSCGGPIVFPSANSFVITPVSPHNLSARPLVVPDTARMTLNVKSRDSKFAIACDGRSSSTDVNTELSIQKAPFQAKLVKVNPSNLFDSLREKLHWGLDIRN